MELEAILEASRRRPAGRRGGHSPLYWWVWENFETVAPVWSKRPYWDGAAEALVKQHPGELVKLVEDGDGKPPTGGRLRKVFIAVRADKAREAGEGDRPKRQRKPAAAAPPAAAASVSPPAAAAAAPGGDDDLGLTFAGGRR